MPTGRRGADPPPTVRACSSLAETISTSDILSSRYGRSMSSNWVVGYIEGVVDFISPPAAHDYALRDPSNWAPLYDRVVAMLDRGEAAAVILCNGVRQRAGVPTFPVPPPAPPSALNYEEEGGE